MRHDAVVYTIQISNLIIEHKNKCLFELLVKTLLICNWQILYYIILNINILLIHLEYDLKK